jgi:hypothetical protein
MEGPPAGSSGIGSDLAEWRADRALADASARRRAVASAAADVELSLGGGSGYVTKADLATLSRELEMRRAARGASQRAETARAVWEASGGGGDGPEPAGGVPELPAAPHGSATFADAGIARTDERLAEALRRMGAAGEPGPLEDAEALLRGLEGRAASVSRLREAMTEGAPSFLTGALEAKAIRSGLRGLSDRVEGVEATEGVLASAAEDAWGRIREESGDDASWPAVAAAELEGFREKANREALERAARDMQGLRYVQLQIAESLRQNQSDMARGP